MSEHEAQEHEADETPDDGDLVRARLDAIEARVTKLEQRRTKKKGTDAKK